MQDLSAPQAVALDLEPHLPLVTHVVRQLASRVPSHVSREAMWVHGAIGLALAAQQHAVAGGAGTTFGIGALRAVRDEVVEGLRRNATLPSNTDLAAMLGTTTDVVARHRTTLAAPGKSFDPAGVDTPSERSVARPRVGAWAAATA